MGVLTARKYVGGVRVCFSSPSKRKIFFCSKLLLGNAASFTSSMMKDLCQKMQGKTNFYRLSETGIVECF